jgi:SpoVK/Ycf46/Vps4 family AAA+-type ATPase
MSDLKYEFLSEAGRTINSLQSSVVFLTGNVNDHFYNGKERNKYVPLLDLLKDNWDVEGKIIVTYKLNGGINFIHSEHQKEVARAFGIWRGFEDDYFDHFDNLCKESALNPSLALQLLRQICLCSSAKNPAGISYLEPDVIIIMETAEIILPAEELGHLSDADRMRIEICRDWFKDPTFMNSADAVVIIAESKSLVHPMVARLPHVVEIEIPSPNDDVRSFFIEWFDKNLPANKKLKLWGTKQDLAKVTAGLSILALRGILQKTSYMGNEISLADITEEVKKFIKMEIGDIIELKVPKHTLKDVCGFKKIKKYAKEKVIPRFKSTGSDALPGATICGPIGVGKTFFWEAVAAESEMIVLVLTGIRSKWFGESDLRLERLKRILSVFVNVIIFIDEADAQFTNLSDPDQHETERRIQGGLLGMMADPALRGKVKWLLITARVDRLSHDMMRPGRPGSLVIPMLDPEGEDRTEFLKWAVQPVLGDNIKDKDLKILEELTTAYFAAMYSELRSELSAESKNKKLTLPDVKSIIEDILHPAIKSTRDYQILCAKLNCNRKSLLPEGEDREKLQKQLDELLLRRAISRDL